MDMFMDDISQLVKETFDNVYQHENSLDNLPESAGVIYHVEHKGSIFVIRAVESRDIAQDMDHYLNDAKILQKLRLAQSENPKDEIRYFACDDYFMAKNIVENLANKRFPLFEEHIMNVSDPGDSWWLKRENDSMSLYFKLCRTESIHDMIKLGPIGDNLQTEEVFKKLYGYFSLIFEVKDFSSQTGAFHITPADPEDPMYLEFINLFENGEVGYKLMDHLRALEEKSSKESFKASVRRANYFLLELAHMRGFWKEIEEIIN
jgi:hypothetical protein